MSYARFGNDSDVYIIANKNYDKQGNRISGCRLCCYDGEDGIFCTADGNNMLTHLENHKKKGHMVPEGAIERIKSEMKDGVWEYPDCDDDVIDNAVDE